MTDESRYEVIDDSHGEGGFGRVSKRRDTVLDRFVAVKELQLLKDDEAKARFKREAKALAKMSHPNIPAIYDVDFAEDRMLIYFEFLDGKNLRALINDSSIPSLAKARRWFTQVAAALGHAHALDITHRDVKPENIIISDNDENAFLVDFGIALSKDDAYNLTQSGLAIGTPAYMSPEQKEGEEIDARSDIYSLGLSLYEVLCGHLPHAGSYQRLSDVNESIPPAIDDLIEQCIIQDKNARLQTSSDFISHLRSAFHTDAPLSTLLTDARLHELIGALEPLTAEDFSGKPRGQKLLLIRRLDDLIRINRSELRTATAHFITLLVRLCTFETAKDYRPIIDAAFSWGFGQQQGSDWYGDQDIREAVIDASRNAKGTAHEVISQAFIAFTQGVDFETAPNWYNHDVRQVAMILLANQDCGTETADSLAEIYDVINQATHK